MMPATSIADAAPARRLRALIVPLAGALLFAPAAASSYQDPPAASRPHRLPALPPAQIDHELQIGGEDIAARATNTRMTVQVQIDGRGPYRFVVDSGADTSVVGTRLARTLNLPVGGRVVVHGMTASATVDKVRVGSLGLGQSVVRDLVLPVLKEEDLGGHGMLGIDALTSQRLMMDFDKKVITIEDARKPQPKRVEGEVVVVARRRRGQLILTEAGVDKRRVDAVIDTGSEISIGNSALRAKLAKRYANRLESIEMTGVTGVTARIDLIRVAELRVGPIVLRNVPIAFADVPPFQLFGLDQQPAMLLGTDMMGTFRRVSLDFKARKVRFQLRRCEERGISISTSNMMNSSRIGWHDPGGADCARVG